MNALLDCPFPIAWTAEALADAVPRPLSQRFDPATLDIAAPAPRIASAPALLHRYLGRRDLPSLFHIH